MKKSFDEYLKSIGLADPLKNRVAIILEDYKQICAQPINDIFISEFLKEDGTREYESLWLFSDDFMMEAKNFISADDFDIAPLSKLISYYKINKKEYRFEKPTDQSKLTIEFSTKHKIRGTLKASKTNCFDLWKIYLKYIKPNLKAESSWL
jgi:hypothetical protein